MNMLASECSSGCESGWTLYLEHSFLSADPLHRGSGFVDGEVKRGKDEAEEEEEEEEDLSMVSDASSGPPHFQEDEGYCNDDNGCFYPHSMAATLVKNNGKRQKIRTHRGRVEQEDPSFLDDTASSPLFNFSKNNGFTLNNNQASMESVLDFSQGFSTTHFKGRSAAFQKHLGLLHSSMSGNQLQQNQWFEGKRMGMR